MTETAAGATEQPRLFTRKSSGLVRAIGAFGAMSFGVACISLSSSGIISFQWVPSLWPGASLVGILTVAMVFGLFHAFTYAQIGSAMPRSGADYALASRTLHPMPAFVSSFVLVLFSGLVAGSLISWIPTVVLPSFFQSWGILFDQPWALDAADWSATATGITVIGLIGVALTLLTLLLRTTFVVRMMQWGFVLGVAAWLLILLAFALGDRASFISNWNQYLGEGNFQQVIQVARDNGLGEATRSTAQATLAGLIMGFWVYYGYYIPTFFAGELKQAPRTLLLGGFGSLLVTWGIFALGAVLLTRIVGGLWLSAEGYLASAGVEGFEAMPFVTFYAGVLMPNPLVFAFIAIAFIFTLINLAQTYFFYCSRIVFAWAFDRVVPEKLSYVHPRTGSPVVSVVLIAVLAAVGVVLSAQQSVLFVQMNFVFFAVVTMLVPVLAVIVFPFKNKELYDRSASLVKSRIFGMPSMTIVGLVTMAYLLWMILSVFIYGAVGFADTGASLRLLAVMIVVGIFIFYGVRWYRKGSEGIDIMQVYQEIPPA